MPWAEESVFDGKIPSDTASFWSGILQYKTKTGEQPFEKLAMYALSCLATPTSNAVVERIFSTVTNVKTKVRNRLQSEMLDASSGFVYTSSISGKVLYGFQSMHARMLQLFTSENMYGNQTGQPDEPEEVSEEKNILECIM